MSTATRGLVLSGGGSKGAYQAGAIKYLMHELGRRYSVITGVSVGALNAAFLAQYPIEEQGQAALDLEALWRGIRGDRDIYRSSWWGMVRSLWSRPHLFNNVKPLEALLERELDPRRVQDSGVLLRIRAVDLQTKQAEVFDGFAPDLIGAVLASSSFPVAFPPRRVQGAIYSDGGLRDVTPLGDGIEAGATALDVIVLSPEEHESSAAPRNVVEMALEAVDIMGDEIVENDLRVARAKNTVASLAKAANATHRRERKIALHILRPQVPPMKSSLHFRPADIAHAFDVGYEDARRVFGGAFPDVDTADLGPAPTT